MQVAEAMERDKRRNNLIIMGLVEERNEHESEKKRNDCGYDRHYYYYRVVVDKEYYIEIEVKRRIGKVNERSARSVRIKIESPAARRLILKKASTLKSNKKYEKIYVVPDLTRKQQEEDKQLRDKLKEYRGQGMEGIKISRGCIVKEER